MVFRNQNRCFLNVCSFIFISPLFYKKEQSEHIEKTLYNIHTLIYIQHYRYVYTSIYYINTWHINIWHIYSGIHFRNSKKRLRDISLYWGQQALSHTPTSLLRKTAFLCISNTTTKHWKNINKYRYSFRLNIKYKR